MLDLDGGVVEGCLVRVHVQHFALVPAVTV
jgi:hypothetical protein